MNHYTGPDRREGVLGRREHELGECAVHTFVMENCAAGKKDTAEKIKELSKEKMDWKVFIFVAVLGAGIIGSGFGYFGSQLAGVDKKYSDRDEKIAATLMQVSNLQSGMLVEISYLKENDARQERMNLNPQRKEGTK